MPTTAPHVAYARHSPTRACVAMLTLVEGYELGFWTTAANIAAVLGLTLVIEVRYQFRAAQERADAGSTFLRAQILAPLLVAGPVILVIFFLSVGALMTGEDVFRLRTVTAVLLLIAFIAVVIGPLVGALVDAGAERRRHIEKGRFRQVDDEPEEDE